LPKTNLQALPRKIPKKNIEVIMKYLVLIETSGNQRYIFSTNKLRENVGASELIHKIGAEFAENLAKSTNGIERIITISGKALLLADDESIAKNFVKEITLHALKQMPGLTINGAICIVKNDTDKTEAENLHKAVGDVHRRLEDIRYQIPSNLQRFQRIPFVAECSSSNLPASEPVEFKKINGKDIFTFSKVTVTKRKALAINKDKFANKDDFKRGRIIEKLEKDFNITIPINLEKLDEAFPKTKWLAVVHADGNGLGQIFLKFNEHANMSSVETYKEDYKDFSNEIDNCTKNAFGEALQKLQEKFGSEAIPVVPLILGGDDLTFICDGEYAISLTKGFLHNFEKQCSTNPVIKRLTTKEGRATSLGICAGIAIIKPKFPFHQAYSLAEQLLQSAKKTKLISTSISAFDYHVLYDSSGTTLEEIRGKTPFVARPYIVTPKKTAKSYTDDSKKQDWIENHHFCKLAKRVLVMTAKDDDDKNQLPNSQMHVLREGLFVADTTVKTQKEVDARAKLIAHRYPNFKYLFVKDETLFFDEDGEKLTHFLDALDIVEFWK